MDRVLDIRPKGRNIIVTGGYGYLGSAICRSLVEFGATVYVLARDKAKFDHEFQANENLIFVEGDISNEESLKKAFGEIHDLSGKIDVLINNAFYSKGQSPTEMSRDDFNYTLDGTLTSVFSSIKLILSYLSDGGKIINVSSMYGMVAPDFDVYKESPQFLNPPHYGTAKAGIIQLTKYYASLLGEKGITVNSVTPGPFPSLEVKSNAAFIENLKNKTCLNRVGSSNDLAGIFSFLSSDAANFITGQNFVVDGGWTVK